METAFLFGIPAPVSHAGRSRSFLWQFSRKGQELGGAPPLSLQTLVISMAGGPVFAISLSYSKHPLSRLTHHIRPLPGKPVP